MGITINALYHMDDSRDRHYGTVTHNGNTCDAVLAGRFEELQSLLHTEAAAEYTLNEIISVEANLPRDDSVSGIYALPDDQIAVDGTVHNELKLDETLSLFDIYMQNGADYLEVSTEDIQVHLEVGKRVRIVCKGVHVYPIRAA